MMRPPIIEISMTACMARALRHRHQEAIGRTGLIARSQSPQNTMALAKGPVVRPSRRAARPASTK